MWVSECVHGRGLHMFICVDILIYSFFFLDLFFLNKQRINCSTNFIVTPVTMTIKNSDSLILIL